MLASQAVICKICSIFWLANLGWPRRAWMLSVATAKILNLLFLEQLLDNPNQHR
jgi:hypothetical protein